MVKVVPFKAYRYDPNVVGDLSKVVAPPYDVIKGKKVDEIQGLSPYNVAWVTKNKPREGDTPESNQYTRAREIMEKWFKEGALKQDAKECFYIYGQNFKIGEHELFRYGFIGLLQLEDFGKAASAGAPFTGVLQHEETLPKDILDRLSLYRQTHVQEGQIFVIYPDHEGKVDSILERYMKLKPAIDVFDADGVRDRIWVVDGDEDIKWISSVMGEKYVIIADGHHRYKTALAFRDENPANLSAKYRMMTFVNIANPGLVILPTHRLVQNLERFSGAELLSKASEHFQVKEFKTKRGMFNLMDRMFASSKHSFGLFMNDGKYYCLTLNDESVMVRMLPDRSEQLAKLDVSILHSLLLDRILGIDKEKLLHGTMSGGGYVVYIKGIGDAVDESIEMVQKGAQAVFFMNPTRIGEVEAVARNFECMPQKSTFFHPKVWTGFTFNKV
jgi:uncharacterized protein (DUF1015 family)